MDRRPIGVFDSGLGGLTAVKELRRLAPEENIVYFGDTARVPYGSRSRTSIVKCACQDVAFLKEQNVKYLIAACGTVSANVDESFSAGLGLPFQDVIGPACAAAAKATRTGRIGLCATSASIRSGAYERTLHLIDPGLTVFPEACPLFVPLVEQGLFAGENEIVRLTVELYLKPLKELSVDTLILGCTHYPLLAPLIAEYLGSGVTLIDAGKEAVTAALSDIRSRGIEGSGTGTSRYFVSDDMESFVRSASLFLGTSIDGAVSETDIEQFEGVKLWKNT